MDIFTFKTVLVAEDDDFMRHVLVAVLTRIGGRVIDCANGKQALAVLNEPIKIDIALLDVLISEMHGLYVLQQVRAGLTSQDFAMPVMLLTATRDEASVHHAAGLSCGGFLLKPINHGDVTARLTRIDVGPPTCRRVCRLPGTTS